MSKYDEALKAINRMYSDLTVAPEATLELLRDLRCEIDDLITAIQQDIAAQETDNGDDNGE